MGRMLSAKDAQRPAPWILLQASLGIRLTDAVQQQEEAPCSRQG
jgi:hypothetical protein